MKSIAVYCGSSPGHSPVFLEAARQLGGAIADRGIELVFGGSHVGCMGAVADAALARGGKVTGVLPRFMADKELAHTKLTKLHLVETMHERKRMMAELAQGFVALPGGYGTFEEIFEVATWSQLQLHKYPVAFLNVAGYYDHLVTFLRGSVTHGFVRPELFASLIVAGTPDELFAKFSAYQPETVEKWVPQFPKQTS